MNRFFLLVCFTLLSMQESLVFAQTVNKLNKQNKEFIKQYKKTAQGGLSVAGGCRCLTKELDMIAC